MSCQDRDLTILTSEIKVARQDPRYRGPEEGRNAKRTYYFKACTAKMPDKENFPWRTKGDQKKPYKDILKASLNFLSIPTECCEQIAQDRAKWSCLVRKIAAVYEAESVKLKGSVKK